MSYKRKPPVDQEDEPDPEPYTEPDPPRDVWPDDWEPHQKENWLEHGEPVYANLETEAGKYWYRRTWRPKKQLDGMMKREHVELTTTEDYIAAEVEARIYPDASVTSKRFRVLGRHGEDEDELDTAIEDITQATIAAMEPENRTEIDDEGRQLAQSNGITIDG